MKKMTKRLLSVLLSVLMVCTVMPFTAITAYASTTLFTYEFSDAYDAEYNSADYLFKINYGATYGKIEGGKLSLNDDRAYAYVNPKIRNDSYNTNWEITASVRVTGTDNGDESQAFILGLSDGNSLQSEGFFGVSTGGIVTCNGSTDSTITVTPNTDYTLKYVYNDGSVSIQLDGSTVYSETVTGSEKTRFENITYVLVGGYHSGFNCDVQVDIDYIRAVSGNDAPTGGDGLLPGNTSLADAKDEFVSRINAMRASTTDNLVTYTNIGPAYTAYINASAAGAGETERAALVSKLNDMQPFDVADREGKELIEINGTEAVGGYGNVLYSADPGTVKYSSLPHSNLTWSNGILTYNDDWWIYQRGGVLLYTGETDAALPAVFAEKTNQGNWGFRYGYVRESGGRLKRTWRGVTTTGSSDSSSEDVAIGWSNSTSYPIPIALDSTDYYDAQAEHGSNSAYWNFGNAMVFELDDNTLFKKYTKFEWNTDAYWGNILTGNKHDAEGEQRLNTTEAVYVLNYKMLINAMLTCITNNKDTNLVMTSEGALAGDAAGVFAAFDYATSLKLDNAHYHYDTNLETGFENAYNDLNTAIKNLTKANSAAGSINTIIEMIKLYEQNMYDNPLRTDLAYTYKLYLKAKECFDAYVYGQRNDQAFLDVLEQTAGDFKAAVTNSIPIADVDLTGHYTPGENDKYFNQDSSSGTAAYSFYNTKQSAKGNSSSITITDVIGAANLLYYAEADDPIVFQPTTSGNNGNEVGVKIFHSNNIVMLYDGITTPKFPVAATFSNITTDNWFGSQAYVDSIYPTDAAAQAYTKADLRNGVGSYLHDNSASFNISKFPSIAGEDWTSTANSRVWLGRTYQQRGSNPPNSYEILWNKQSTVHHTNAIPGDATLGFNTAHRLWVCRNGESNYCSGALASVDYVSTTFETNPTQYLDPYSHLNWNVITHASSSQYSFPAVYQANSAINVINIKPLLDKRAELLDDDEVRAILKHLFLYDQDSADMIAFMEKIDSVGSFDPNDYDYSQTTGGTHGYSSYKGVDDCVYDLATAVRTYDGVTDAVDKTTGHSVAENTNAGDGVIVVPTDAEQAIASTSTEQNNPSTDNWYGDLRKALLNPLTKETCSEDDAWTAYENALNAARNAISAPAMAESGYYPEAPISGNVDPDTGKAYDVHYYADALNDATDNYKTAGVQHTYLYGEENEDQIADWECLYNTVHTHGTSDMSAYNELEIAYKTIDLDAYKPAAKTAMDAAYDDGNYTDEYSDQDQSNISFVEVKTRPTVKGQSPQNYVDTAVVGLLEAINEAGEGGTESLNYYNVNFNVVIDNGTPVSVMTDQPMAYGSTTSFVATDAAGFPTGATCYKWTVQRDGENEQTIYHNSNTLSNFVQANTTVTAYVNTPANAQEDMVNVMIYGPTKLRLYDINVSKDATVNFGTLDENGYLTVTIDGHDYTVTSSTAYAVTGWTIGVEQNEEVYEGTSGNGLESYTVEALRAKRGLTYLKIYPHITQRVTDGYVVSYSGDTPATINVNGTDQTLGDVDTTLNGNTITMHNAVDGIQYDDKVTITYTPNDSKGTFYGIAINVSEMTGGTVPKYVPISYGTSFYFRANSIMNVYPIYQTKVTVGDSTANVYTVEDGRNNGAGTKITNPTDRYYLNRHLPFVVDLFDTTNVSGKYVFRVMFTQNLPDDVVITEHGYNFLRLNSAQLVEDISAGESDLVAGKSWEIGGTTYAVTQKPASKTYDPVSHQFSFSTTVPPSGSYAYQASRGYVKFTYDFEQTVVDANEQATDYSAELEAISYGRADFYIHNVE